MKKFLIVGLMLVTKQGFADSWAKTFGGTGKDCARSVHQTQDSGYIVAGWTESFGAGEADFLVLKLNGGGIVEWAKTFGGTNEDHAYSVQQTQDGGYIVAGGTYSFGAGSDDFLVLKLNGSGTQQWAKTFGGTYEDCASSVQQTQDGGYIVAGFTSSFGAGDYNFLVLKLNSYGTQEWAKTFGGTDDDCAHSVHQTQDGGYIVAEYTNSFGAGDADFLIIKIEPDGSMASDCPWYNCTPTITNQSLGAVCIPLVSSPSLGADCTPLVGSPTLLTSHICGGR